MGQLINATINVEKIDKSRLFKGEKGTYLNVVVSELQQPDQYGNTHSVYMQQTKEERDAKEQKIYLGNGKALNFDSGQPQPSQAAPQSNESDNSDSSSLPF